MGRIRSAVACISLTVMAPADVQAAMLHLPEWIRCSNGGQEMACYTFEQAKELKKFDQKYQLLEESLRLTDLELEARKQETAALYYAIADKDEEISLLDNHLTQTQKDRDQLLRDLSAANGRDILGGGFPWVIAAVAAGMVAGAAVVIFVTHN